MPVKPLPEENLPEVPYGDPKCRLCRLPLEDLKLIHALKFKEKYSYKKMREFLKERYGIGNDYTYLTNHFKRHTSAAVNAMVRAVNRRQSTEVLLGTELPTAGFNKTDFEVERLYDKLVRMTVIFTEKLDMLYKELERKFSNEDEIKKELKEYSAIGMLASIAKLNSLARDQVKDISALRAPKVVVLQFLEDTLDKAISEINDTVTSLFIMVQRELTAELQRRGFGEGFDNKVFQETFSKVAATYKEKILTLRREQIGKAATTLAELEKIV